MNYITGLSIGLSVGKQLHSMFNKNESTIKAESGFILVHSLPGRRRYRNTALCDNVALAAKWQTQMLRLPQVSKVTMNTICGTFLIEYTCSENHIDRLMLCLADMEQSVEQGEPAGNSCASGKMPLGKIGMGIRQVFADLNCFIRRISQQEWDLATICAVIFSFIGIQKIITLRQVPSGPQLLWWAFGMLKGRLGVC